MHCKFAIRGAGHMANPGFSGIGSDGIVIDLKNLDQITLSEDKSIASVGSAARWDNVYEELEKHELTVVGGRVAGVGVGGLLLGGTYLRSAPSYSPPSNSLWLGGMSHFSNHWGMAVDNVEGFEVVLANSSIVQANKNKNEDLYEVLKGGGPNFGILTRCDLQTKPDYKLWYTVKVYSVDDADRVMEAAVEVEKMMAKNARLGFFLTVNPTSLVAGMLHCGWATTRPEGFSAFDDIKPVATAIPETNGTQKSSAQALTMNESVRRAVGTATVKPDAKLYAKTLKILQEIVKAAPNISLCHTFQPLSASSVESSRRQGGNLLNVPSVSQDWLAIAGHWDSPEDDATGVEQVLKLARRIKTAAASEDKLLDFQFMNDSNFTQSPLKAYGEKSLAKMKEAAQKYDPHGAFQKLQNDGFLLSKLQ